MISNFSPFQGVPLFFLGKHFCDTAAETFFSFKNIWPAQILTTTWTAFGTIFRATGGFRKLEQLLESQAAIGRPELLPKEACWKDVKNK
jgi:hypothetical protein